MYNATAKMIDIAAMNNHEFLFWDVQKDEPFTEHTFRLFVAEAHKDLDIGVRLLRIIDESAQLADVGSAAETRVNAHMRGHSFHQSLLYAKSHFKTPAH